MIVDIDGGKIPPCNLVAIVLVSHRGQGDHDPSHGASRRGDRHDRDGHFRMVANSKTPEVQGAVALIKPGYRPPPPQKSTAQLIV
jgi:hypothetical protein